MTTSPDDQWVDQMEDEGWWQGPDGRWYAPPAWWTDEAFAEEDSFGKHLLVYLGVALGLQLSIYLFGLGLFWIWWMIRSTGRSGWSFLLLLVPFANVYVFVTAVWRYTSKTIYFVQDSPGAGPPRTLFTSKWQEAHGWERLSLHGIFWSVSGRPDQVAELERRASKPAASSGLVPPGLD